MIRRFAVRYFILVLALSLAIATLAQLPAKQFAADMKFTSKDMSATGRLYYGSGKVRMEMNALGRQSIMITDPERKVTYILLPDQHMYMEISADTAAQAAPRNVPVPDWHMYDPANPCASTPDTTCKPIGTGMTDSRLCDKWVFTHKGGNTQTVWIDQKTKIPLRIEGSDGSAVELTNLKQEPQSDGLFELPAGYTKLDLGATMKDAPKNP